MDTVGKISCAYQRDKATRVRQAAQKRNQFRRQLPFRTFRLQPKLALGEAMTDSDLITAFSCEIPADAESGEVVAAAETTKDQIIAAHRIGGRVTLTAVVLGKPRLLDN